MYKTDFERRFTVLIVVPDFTRYVVLVDMEYLEKRFDTTPVNSKYYFALIHRNWLLNDVKSHYGSKQRRVRFVLDYSVCVSNYV